MATNFGKGNRSIAFNPTSAFPLDARAYFENTSDKTAYAQALEVAQNAKEVGNTDTQYHYGMKLLVNDNEVYTWYKIVKGEPYLEEEGSGSAENGATFTPSVSSDGTLSWTNDKGLTNPASVNIKGDDGVGIEQIYKSSSAGLVDTYTIVYTNGTTSTFKVTNGKDGTGGSGSSSLALPMVSVSGYDTITAGELVTELRNNGITEDDLVLIDFDKATFIGRVGDPYLPLMGTVEVVPISCWFSLGAGINYAPFLWVISVDTLVTDFSTKSLYQLRTENKGIIPAINEIYDKLPSADTVEMPIIRFVGAKSRRADIDGDEEFPPTEMNLTNGISFIVEMTGGGSIQSGDSIQICQMKTYWYGKGSSLFSKYRKQKLRCVAERVIEKEYLQEINRYGWKYLILNSWETNEGKLNAAFCHNGRKDSHRVSSLYIRIRRPKGDLQNNESGRTVDAYFSNVVEITRKYSGDKMHFE